MTGATRAATSKAPTPRLKLEIRRLPPGLTLTEFEEILGPEWTLGKGKVDWREYRQGKLKHGIGKVPEQSRCYLHLVSEPLVKEFEALFFRVVFHDKAGTYRSPDLKHLPPTIGFAPNQRTPLSVKPKWDNRQGTIDQDPEFIRFLEAETQPIVKPAALDTVGAEKEKAEKTETTSTPLIEAIREKKANKAKAAAAKEEKREAKAQAKPDSKQTNTEEKTPKGGKNSNPPKAEQAQKDTAKSSNKNTASKHQPQAPATSQQAQSKQNASPSKPKKAAANGKAPRQEAANTSSTTSGSTTPAPQRGQRQRGNPDAIKKIFQKDLGLKPKASSTNSDASTTQTQAAASTSSEAAPATVKPAQQANTGNAKGPAQTKASAAPKQASQPSAKQHALKAYLKHANPSQGMTEDLIKQALAQYGEVVEVTIDSRKGTAVAAFADADGLKKAIETRRVPVASGTVEVLEFRDRGSSSGGGRGGNRAGKGGGRGARGGGQANTAPPTTDAGKAPA